MNTAYVRDTSVEEIVNVCPSCPQSNEKREDMEARGYEVHSYQCKKCAMAVFDTKILVNNIILNEEQ